MPNWLDVLMVRALASSQGAEIKNLTVSLYRMVMLGGSFITLPFTKTYLSSKPEEEKRKKKSGKR